MELTLKKSNIKEFFLKSITYSLIEDNLRQEVLDSIDKANAKQLDLIAIKLYENEEKMEKINKEISDIEDKKKELEDKKKEFLLELRAKIKQDEIESSIKAEEILKNLSNL